VSPYIIGTEGLLTRPTCSTRPSDQIRIGMARRRLGATSFTIPDLDKQEVEKEILGEQHEVNAGVRATFGAVHSTLNSQGAAIRGLEEVIKKVLPELDRLTDLVKDAVPSSDVARIAENLSKVAEDANFLAANAKEIKVNLDAKFDAQLGQRALEALARQQAQAEHEAAAREAVGGEVVRLVASTASFTQVVESVRVDCKKLEPRVDGLERRTQADEEALEAYRRDTDRRLTLKADGISLEALARTVGEDAAEAQRRWTKLEAEAKKQHTEALKVANEKMPRREAQQALDALAEAIARQAHEHAQAGARLADAMAARLERSEADAAQTLSQLQAEEADWRAEAQSQLSALQQAIDAATGRAERELRAHRMSAEREAAELRSTGSSHADRLDEQSALLSELRADAAGTAREAAALTSASARAAGVIEQLRAHGVELEETVDRLGARHKALGQTVERELGLCSERVEGLEGHCAELHAALSTLTANGQPLTASDLANLEHRVGSLEGALTSTLEELRRRELARDTGHVVQRTTDAMRLRLEQLEQKVSDEAEAAEAWQEEARRAGAAAAAAELAAQTAAASAQAAATAAATAVGPGSAAATPMRLLPPPPPVQELGLRATPQRRQMDDVAAAAASAAADSAAAAAKASAADAAMTARLVEMLQRQVEALHAQLGQLNEEAVSALRDRDEERRAEQQRRQATDEALRALRRDMAVVQEEAAATRAELHALRSRATPAPPVTATATATAPPTPSRPTLAPSPMPTPAAPLVGGSGIGSSMELVFTGRLTALEAAHRAIEAAQRDLEGTMASWTAEHARKLELLASQALSGKWIGLVGMGGSAVGGAVGSVVGSGATAGAGVLVCWHEQAANTYEGGFGWTPRTHEVNCAAAGVYEVAVGLWPASPGLLAELRVNGATAMLLTEPPAALAHLGAEAGGLCAVSLLSLPAGAAVSLAAEHATRRTKAYLGLRKL